MPKERDFAIDVLKMLAVLTIVWSHLDPVFPKPFDKLATGGSFGDGFFFFCSGFTILLGGGKRFDNYYKRRIYRIFPSVIAWGIVSMLFFGRDPNAVNLVNGGWFLECIMIYYVPLWLIKRYWKEHLKTIFLIYSVGFTVFFVWYAPADHDLKMIDNALLKSLFFFLVMLMGAYTGLRRHQVRYRGRTDLAKLIVSVCVFCGSTYARKYNLYLQLLCVPGLVGTCYYTYKLCNTQIVHKAFSNQVSYSVMRFIGSLCLEVYFVNIPIINATEGLFWPLRLVVIALATVATAYAIRCLSRWLLQTFNEADYDWKGIIKLY